VAVSASETVYENEFDRQTGASLGPVNLIIEISLNVSVYPTAALIDKYYLSLL
jgi:hypothetical protein